MSAKKITYHIQPGGKLSGTFSIPGDKSISHRAVMLGSLAKGITEVSGFLEAEDSLVTMKAFQDMGVQIERPEAYKLIIHGVGIHGLHQPKQPLYLGNAGTAMRLLAGLLSGQAFNTELIGDESLMQRPMQRVVEPLMQMGAKIFMQAQGTAPLLIQGGQLLKGIRYKMPMASAQVKSCLLLAGLYANGVTEVIEPAPTRDHTERMLKTFGYSVMTKGSQVILNGGGELKATKIHVPADISSAAFFIVGASIAKNSDITLKHIGINSKRIGIINIMRMMGAKIDIGTEVMVGQEPVADIRIRSASLHGITVPMDQVPLAIDEFPAIFIAAACAKGTTILRGAKELRVKESDRILTMANGLHRLGIKVEALPDGIVIEGGQFSGGEINSAGDHRVAMAFAMAALVAKEPILINDCENVATSFPNFLKLAQEAGLRIEVE